MCLCLGSTDNMSIIIVTFPAAPQYHPPKLLHTVEVFRLVYSYAERLLKRVQDRKEQEQKVLLPGRREALGQTQPYVCWACWEGPEGRASPCNAPVRVRAHLQEHHAQRMALDEQVRRQLEDLKKNTAVLVAQQEAERARRQA